MKRGPANQSQTRVRASFAESLIWLALQAVVVAIPLLYSHGRDVYRLPKLLLFEAAAMILFAACVAVSLLGRSGILQRLMKHRWPLWIAVAAVAWTALTTLTSTQRAISLETLLWVACGAAFFLVSVALTEPRPLAVAAIALVPAIINAAVVILQRLQIWNPFRFSEEIELRLRVIGFIGNSNDVAGYLVLPCLAAIVLSILRSGLARVLYAMAALLLVAGIAVSETMTAAFAVAAALVVIILMVSRRRGVLIALAATMVLVVMVSLQLPAVARLRDKLSDAFNGRFDIATSGRIQGLASAWVMFREHPLTGVGPGCFAYWYLPYNIQLSGTHPEYMNTSSKFGDVHNDYLQLLATTGLPGSCLLLVALWRFGAYSSRTAATPRQRFVHLFAAPAAIAVAILTMGQFALELATQTSTFLYFAAIAAAWSPPS
jgi:O-antigen ligase